MSRDRDLKNWNLTESKVEPGNGAKTVAFTLVEEGVAAIKNST